MQDTAQVLPQMRTWPRLFLFTSFSVITLAPLTLVHAQWLTGPLVNAMLLLTCTLVGPVEAVILGLFPSPTALVSGLLPLPLAPMLPFIMIGNAMYVAVFFGLRKQHYLIGVLGASLVKYLVLTTASSLVARTLLPAALIPTAATMMGILQFATALAGGVIAWFILSSLPRRD